MTATAAIATSDILSDVDQKTLDATASRLVKAGSAYTRYDGNLTKLVRENKDDITTFRSAFGIGQGTAGKTLSLMIDGISWTGKWKKFLDDFWGKCSPRHMSRLLGEKPIPSVPSDKPRNVKIKPGDYVTFDVEIYVLDGDAVTVPMKFRVSGVPRVDADVTRTKHGIATSIDLTVVGDMKLPADKFPTHIVDFTKHSQTVCGALTKEIGTVIKEYGVLPTCHDCFEWDEKRGWTKDQIAQQETEEAKKAEKAREADKKLLEEYVQSHPGTVAEVRKQIGGQLSSNKRAYIAYLLEELAAEKRLKVTEEARQIGQYTQLAAKQRDATFKKIKTGLRDDLIEEFGEDAVASCGLDLEDHSYEEIRSVLLGAMGNP